MNIGILGGTFDPPHIAHLLMAQDVRQFYPLDEVWFLPSALPPHKTEQGVTPAAERITMVEMAIADNPYFKPCLIEFERDGLSYTYDTIGELKTLYPQHSFYFLMGADMVAYLPQWYNVEAFLKQVQVIAVGRPGFELDSIYANDIHIIECPEIAVSSSMIRQRIQKNQSIRYWVPENVEQYMRKQGLYE